MWYQNLATSPNEENLIENLKTANDGYSEEQCLFLSKISKLDQKLSLDVGNCKEKHSAICRVEPQNVNVLKETSNFPCLAEHGIKREKRSATDKTLHTGDKDKGSVLNVF